MRLAKHVLRWCRAKKAACRCLGCHTNKPELWKKNNMAHTKLQCAAKKLLHRPSSARRSDNRITCNSPDPKGFPRMKITRGCELRASLLDHVAEAPWGFNGMNVKGDFAVDDAKDTRKSGLGSPKLPCGLPNMFFAGAVQRKLPVDAWVAIQTSQNSGKKTTWHIQKSNVILHKIIKDILQTGSRVSYFIAITFILSKSQSALGFLPVPSIVKAVNAAWLAQMCSTFPCLIFHQNAEANL